jgi:hypothetical protein
MGGFFFLSFFRASGSDFATVVAFAGVVGCSRVLVATKWDVRSHQVIWRNDHGDAHGV